MGKELRQQKALFRDKEDFTRNARAMLDDRRQISIYRNRINHVFAADS